MFLKVDGQFVSASLFSIPGQDLTAQLWHGISYLPVLPKCAYCIGVYGGEVHLHTTDLLKRLVIKHEEWWCYADVSRLCEHFTGMDCSEEFCRWKGFLSV